MFDKLKLWLMTEENKQKYLMEKEKSEREKKRSELEENTQNKSKKEPENKTKAQNKIKTKKEPENKTKKGILGKKNSSIEPEDKTENLVDEEISSIEDKPKKVVVVKRKSNITEVEVENSSVNNNNSFENIDTTYFNNDNNNDTNLELDKDSDVSSVLNETPELLIPNVEEEFRKKELLLKKKEEEDNYMTILLDLPPTTDESYFIKRAFEAGIPEWFLRDRGYMIDSLELVKEEKVKSKEETLNSDLSIEEVTVNKIKEELKYVIPETNNSDIDILLDDVMEEILETESEILEDEVLEEITKTEEEFSLDLTKPSKVSKPGVETISSNIEDENTFEVDVSDLYSENAKIEEDLNNDKDFLISKLNETDSEPKESTSIDIMVDLINKEKKVLEKNKEEEIKKNSTVIISELRNRVKYKKSEEKSKSDEIVTKDLKNDSDIENTSNKISLNYVNSSVNIPDLKLKAREAIKAAIKDSVNEKVESDTEKKAVLNVEERLKSLKRKREVLSANGNNILVKEDIELGEGKVVTNYKSYNVSEEDKYKIEVGKEIETDVVLNESQVLVDGEVYTLTKEEELELIKKYSVREIWILSSDINLLEKYNRNLEGSRYSVNLIKNEKDFIMAIRSVDNLIVFTKDIPKSVEKSVAGFLKYLKNEQRKARLVTIEESKINSKMMEFSFEDLTIENLNNYYEDFDLSLYREIRKPISELYKEISFDLTNELMENSFIEITVDNSKSKSNGDILLDFESSRVLVDIGNDEKLKQADFELKLDDTVVINLDDLK